MPEYIINYYFDGYGRDIVEANNEEEAREKWIDGDFINDTERGDNYQIENIEPNQ